MADLTYTVIKSDEQYDKYCEILEELVSSGLDSQEAIDEYELLTLLIKDWDDKHPIGPDLDPVELIKSFMEDHGLNQSELAEIVDYSKNYISEILNYKKRIPPKMVRRLADHFKIRQEALNKPYRLDGEKTESKDDPKTSKVFSIHTGNQVRWDESQEEEFSPQPEFEYAEVN